MWKPSTTPNDVLMHSAKGSTWKKHKYLKKIGNTYIYAKASKKASKKSNKALKDAYSYGKWAILDKRNANNVGKDGETRSGEPGGSIGTNAKFWNDLAEVDSKAGAAKYENAVMYKNASDSYKRLAKENLASIPKELASDVKNLKDKIIGEDKRRAKKELISKNVANEQAKGQNRTKYEKDRLNAKNVANEQAKGRNRTEYETEKAAKRKATSAKNVASEQAKGRSRTAYEKEKDLQKRTKSFGERTNKIKSGNLYNSKSTDTGTGGKKNAVKKFNSSVKSRKATDTGTGGSSKKKSTLSMPSLKKSNNSEDFLTKSKKLNKTRKVSTKSSLQAPSGKFTPGTKQQPKKKKKSSVKLGSKRNKKITKQNTEAGKKILKILLRQSAAGRLVDDTYTLVKGNRR